VRCDGITDRVIELGGDEQVTREARNEILADLDLRDAAGTLGERDQAGRAGEWESSPRRPL